MKHQRLRFGHEDRFRKRRPPVVECTPSVSMPRRSASDTARATGYLCEFLESVTVPEDGLLFMPWDFNGIPFRASDNLSDYSDARLYKSMQDEEDFETGVRHARDIEDSDPAGRCVSVSNVSSVAEYTTSLCLMLMTGERGDHSRACLKVIPDELVDRLGKFHWSRRFAATIMYRSSGGKRFQHVLYFLVPPSHHPPEASAFYDDIGPSVACGAEWVLPRKRERSLSVDFKIHSFRIAQSICRDILAATASAELFRLEQQETESLMIRLLDVEPADKQIEKLSASRVLCETKLRQYERKLQEKLDRGALYMTSQEKQECVCSVRDSIERASAEAKQFIVAVDLEIVGIRRKIEEMCRRKRLRETPETSWAFQLFDREYTGEMYTPALRTALFSLETHRTVAAVNESLWRQGKQSNIRLYQVSTVPYTRVCPVSGL